MAIRAIFFDAGGTLIRAWPSVGEVYGRVAADLGFRAAPAAFDALLPVKWREYQERARHEPLPVATSDEGDTAMWRHVARGIYDGIPALAGMSFERWFEGIHGAFSTGAAWKTFPEVPEVLDACRGRGLRRGVVSNWSSSLLAILRDHGLAPLMDFILISALEGCRKPDPAFFRRALAKAEVSAAEALHVGDTYADDAAAARAAGLLGVHLDRKGDGAPHNGGPVVRDLRGILDYL